MDDYGKRFAAAQVATAGDSFRRNWDRPDEVDEAMAPSSGAGDAG